MSSNLSCLFSPLAYFLGLIRLFFSVVLLLSCWVSQVSADRGISSMEELNTFAHNYYLNVSPERVDDALRYVVQHGSIRQPSNEASLSAFFNCLFFRHARQWRRHWQLTVNQFPEYEKKLFTSLLSIAPAQLLVLQPQSPAKNDMYWGCYFSTGDRRYLQAIANGLYFLGERKNKQRFLMAALARWSLVKNAEQHLAIEAFLIELSQSYNAHWRILATDMLSTTPEKISMETAEIMKLQRQAGIW